eukprot:6635707-Prymnesium_polylepis.1
MHFLPRRKGAEIERGSVAIETDQRHIASTNVSGNARAERIACRRVDGCVGRGRTWLLADRADATATPAIR